MKNLIPRAGVMCKEVLSLIKRLFVHVQGITKYCARNNLVEDHILTWRTLAIARPFEGQIDVTIYK